MAELLAELLVPPLLLPSPLLLLTLPFQSFGIIFGGAAPIVDRRLLIDRRVVWLVGSDRAI